MKPQEERGARVGSSMLIRLGQTYSSFTLGLVPLNNPRTSRSKLETDTRILKTSSIELCGSIQDHMSPSQIAQKHIQR